MGCCCSAPKDELREFFDELAGERELLLAGQREPQPTPVVMVDINGWEPQQLPPYYYRHMARMFYEDLDLVATGSEMDHIFDLPEADGNTPPRTILSAPPLSRADCQMIISSAQKIANAYKDIRVQHQGKVVVPFEVIRGEFPAISSPVRYPSFYCLQEAID